MALIDMRKTIESIQHRVCQGNGNKEHVCERGTCAYCGIMEIMNDIEALPTIHDIDRAEILRLCNEIGDIVSEISKLSENYHIYSDCKSILNRTKAIGKELNGDAGTD